MDKIEFLQQLKDEAHDQGYFTNISHRLTRVHKGVQAPKGKLYLEIVAKRRGYKNQVVGYPVPQEISKDQVDTLAAAMIKELVKGGRQ